MMSTEELVISVQLYYLLALEEGTEMDTNCYCLIAVLLSLQWLKMIHTDLNEILMSGLLYICCVFSLSCQVPCSLEYWDELQQAFVPYREFSLSESSTCQLQLPSLSLTNQEKELVASDLWRIVLNNNGDGGEEQR